MKTKCLLSVAEWYFLLLLPCLQHHHSSQRFFLPKPTLTIPRGPCCSHLERKKNSKPSFMLWDQCKHPGKMDNLRSSRESSKKYIFKWRRKTKVISTGWKRIGVNNKRRKVESNLSREGYRRKELFRRPSHTIYCLSRTFWSSMLQRSYKNDIYPNAHELSHTAITLLFITSICSPILNLLLANFKYTFCTCHLSVKTPGA